MVRKGRRKIANVDDFLTALAHMGERWCRQAMPGSMECVVTFDKVMFGKEREDRKSVRWWGKSNCTSSVERDIVPLQEYAVLFGIQVGSRAIVPVSLCGPGP